MASLPTPGAGEALRKELAGLLFGVFIYLFLVDAVHNRLGSSNGKFISFVDTCRSVTQYREGLLEVSACGKKERLLWTTFVACFFVKYASQSLVSVLLGTTPVVFSGPRHAFSFSLGFLVIWLSPGDSAYQTMKDSRALRLLVNMSGGLYKYRKVIFAVEVTTRAKASFPFALFVAVLAVDGTTLTRRCMHWLQAYFALPRRSQNKCYLLVSAGGRGAQRTLLTTILPIGAVTWLIWAAARVEWVFGITDDSFLGLRAALLALFIWRSGALNELARIHSESMYQAQHTAHPEKSKAN